MGNDARNNEAKARGSTQYDFIRYGSCTKRYIAPPRNKDKTGFDEEAGVIAIEKIEELQRRLVEIERKHKEQEPHFLKAKIDNSINIPYLVARFGFEKEKYYIKEWVKYWKNLAGVREEKIFREELNIKQAKGFPLEDLYEGNLRRVANRLQGFCPFHEERSPSFFIFDDNHYHCFGCQEHGGSIDYLMKTKNLDFISAVRQLQR